MEDTRSLGFLSVRSHGRVRTIIKIQLKKEGPLGDPNQESAKNRGGIETILCQSEGAPCPVHRISRGTCEQVPDTGEMDSSGKAKSKRE